MRVRVRVRANLPLENVRPLFHRLDATLGIGGEPGGLTDILLQLLLGGGQMLAALVRRATQVLCAAWPVVVDRQLTAQADRLVALLQLEIILSVCLLGK
jgi:hypothetical protein